MNEDSSESVESVLQLAATWGAVVNDYGRTHGSVDVRDLPGIAVRWADSIFPFWNCITFTDLAADSRLIEDRLHQAADLAKSKSRAGLLWIFEDLLTPEARIALPAIAERAGLAFSLQMYGMAGNFPSIAEPVHPSLQFVRVSTEEQLTAYADINSRAYGLALELGRDGLCGSALWKSGMYSYLALENGVPVAAAATVETDNCLFLAAVATLPEAQRKGYGEAVVRKALFEGAKATGLTRSVLHATMAGAPVYERIGYHKVATIQGYAPAP